MMDELAPLLHEEVVVQGADLFSEAVYEAAFREARVVVAHAGIGTLLTALQLGKPLIVVPRRAALGEQRNDHQVETAAFIRERCLAYVAETGEELRRLLLEEPLMPVQYNPSNVQLKSEVAALVRGRKLMAVSSFGGHTVELKQLVDEAVWVSTGGVADYVVENFSRWSKLKILSSLRNLFLIIRKVRPDVIISTGAAPGVAAMMVGRLCGVETIWVDSLASVHRLSLSGRLAKPFSTHIFTQWPCVAGGRVVYAGSVI